MHNVTFLKLYCMLGIFDEKGVTRRGGTVALSTDSGKALPVSLSIKENKSRFTHDDLRKLQVVQGKSDRGIL